MMLRHATVVVSLRLMPLRPRNSGVRSPPASRPGLSSAPDQRWGFAARGLVGYVRNAREPLLLLLRPALNRRGHSFQQPYSCLRSCSSRDHTVCSNASAVSCAVSSLTPCCLSFKNSFFPSHWRKNFARSAL